MWIITTKPVILFAFRSLIQNFATKVAKFLLSASENKFEFCVSAKKETVSLFCSQLFVNFGFAEVTFVRK